MAGKEDDLPTERITIATMRDHSLYTALLLTALKASPAPVVSTTVTDLAATCRRSAPAPQRGGQRVWTTDLGAEGATAC